MSHDLSAETQLIQHYFIQDEVEEIKLINSPNDFSLSKAAVGTAVFGSGGAILGASNDENLLEVTWKDNSKSLIKVNKYMYEIILSGMYSNITLDSINKEKEERKNNYTEGDAIGDAFGIIFFFVIFIIILFIIM